MTEVYKTLRVRKEEAQRLGRCWDCGDPITKRRRNSRFCSDACKQRNYRLMCKVKSELPLGTEEQKSVTVKPAIAGRNVTNFAFNRTSGETGPSSDTSNDQSQGGAS